MCQTKKGGGAMDKYIDNKLAEELDLIVLLTDRHGARIPKGSVGTLIDSYTGMTRPMYGDFDVGGKHEEADLWLREFRVLNPRCSADVEIIAEYLKTKKAV